jgi:hypothetical protein
MARTTRREFISRAVKLAAGTSVASCFPDVGEHGPVECGYPEGAEGNHDALGLTGEGSARHLSGRANGW